MAAFPIISVSIILQLVNSGHDPTVHFVPAPEDRHNCLTDAYQNDPVLKEAADRSDAAWNAIKEQIPKAAAYPHLDLPIAIHVLYNAANNTHGHVIYPDENQQWYSKYVDILKRMHPDFNQFNQSRTPFALWQNRVANMNITFFIDRIIYKDVGTESPYQVTSSGWPDAHVIQDAVRGDAPVDSDHIVDFWYARGNESWGAYSHRPSSQVEGHYGVKFSMQYLTGERRSHWQSHEMGHWVGLKHIWGLDNPPSCADDDDVNDTPNMASKYNGSCPTNLNGNTCGAGDPGDEPDMFDNIMSYAYCRRFFTVGQLQRSRTPGTLDTPIGILPSFFEYDDPAIRSNVEFLSFFYFVDKEEDCMFRDVKKEFCLKSKNPTIYKKDCDDALCLSYSHNPFVAVYDDLEVIVGDTSSCSPGFQRIDTVLTSAKAVEHSFVCYKKVDQSDPTQDSALIDLDIGLSKGTFTLIMTTANGQVIRRTATRGNAAKAEKAEITDGGDNVYLVTVEHARDLDDLDTDFLWIENYNDVYVQIFGYGDEDEKVLQTDTINGATEPEWNDQVFEFDESRDGVGVYRSFKFKLYDDDTVFGQDLFADAFLGETDEFQVSVIVECDMDYSEEMTVYRDGSESGTLFVTISKQC